MLKKKAITVTAALVTSSAMLLAACGGGGGEGSTPASADAALNGTWVTASDGRVTGGTCGLDIHGAWAERGTMVFANGSYTSKLEVCVSLLGGNTGSYILSTTGEGTYTTGGVYFDGGTPAASMKSIDIRNPTLFYGAYNITGAELRLGVPTVSQDGSTPDKRAYVFQSFQDPVFTKQ